MLLFAQVGNAFTRPFVISLAAVALLSSHLRNHALIWLGIFCLTGYRLFDLWPMVDNHAYLLALWCLALFLYFSRKLSANGLANNARIVVGLVFLLASVQKLNSADYLNGTFFRYLLLTDNRFEDFAVLFGNISYQQIDVARKILDAYQFSSTLPQAEIVPKAAEFHLLVLFSTWWNLLDQIIVACCFLSPVNSFTYKSRDYVLLIFCITTYAVAPVPGFGWLLISMAVAQSESNYRIHAGYIISFFLILFYYQIPWAGILVDFFQPI